MLTAFGGVFSLGVKHACCCWNRAFLMLRLVHQTPLAGPAQGLRGAVLQKQQLAPAISVFGKLLGSRV